MPHGMLYSLVQFNRRMLNILPLVKNVYQIFLCWSLCARLLFSCQDYTMTDWGSWDENKTKIVRGRKGATYKIFDDTHQKYVILALMPCQMGSTPMYYWYVVRKKCKERQSKNYLIKLQRLDSPPHRYTNTLIFYENAPWVKFEYPSFLSWICCSSILSFGSVSLLGATSALPVQGFLHVRPPHRLSLGPSPHRNNQAL